MRSWVWTEVQSKYSLSLSQGKEIGRDEWNRKRKEGKRNDFLHLFTRFSSETSAIQSQIVNRPFAYFAFFHLFQVSFISSFLSFSITFIYYFFSTLSHYATPCLLIVVFDLPSLQCKPDLSFHLDRVSSLFRFVSVMSNNNSYILKEK